MQRTMCRGALTLWPGRDECWVSSRMLLLYHAWDIESAMKDVSNLERTSRSAMGLVSPSPEGCGILGMVRITAVYHSEGTFPSLRHMFSRFAMAACTLVSELNRMSFVSPEFPPALFLPRLASLLVTSEAVMCRVAGPLYSVGARIWEER